VVVRWEGALPLLLLPSTALLQSCVSVVVEGCVLVEEGVRVAVT
jgi:hypothetical protein